MTRPSLTPDDPALDRIKVLLDAGRTQGQIAEILGMHRSSVWRRVRLLKQRQKAESPNGGQSPEPQE